MSTSFNRFKHMWDDKTLQNDVTWRAYDIPAALREKHATAALKALGLSYAGEHAMVQFMALYEVRDPRLAPKILGGWWLWSRLAQGRRIRGVKLRSATTLAEGGDFAAPAPLPAQM